MSFVDATWYQRPPNVPDRTSAGDVVARLADDGRVMVALTREPEWPQFILPKGGVEKGENLEEAVFMLLGIMDSLSCMLVMEPARPSFTSQDIARLIDLVFEGARGTLRPRG